MSKAYPAMPKTCLYCGKPLSRRQSKFCSKNCNKRHWNMTHPRIKKKGKCKNCGKPLGKGRVRYCTNKCRIEYWHKQAIGDYTYKTKYHGKIVCPVCGEEGILAEKIGYRKKTKKYFGMSHFVIIHHVRHYII